MIRIVIVEDELNIRDCLVNLFPWNDLGVSVIGSFNNGQDAFKFLCDTPADILLCDIHLPGISGLDLIRMLREAKNTIQIIILTAYRQFDYAQQAIRYNVSDFLLKPIKYSELSSCILRIKESLSSSSGSLKEVDNNDDQPYHEKIISIAKQFISNNLSSASLETVSLAVNLSSGYFSRLFHQVTGTTFSEYLTICRMKKAAEYLKSIDYKTYQISLMVGYDNPKNFTRAFKQYYQMTPREYRENAIITKEKNHET